MFSLRSAGALGAATALSVGLLATEIASPQPAEAAACTTSQVVSVSAPSFDALAASATKSSARTSVSHVRTGFRARTVARVTWRVHAMVTTEATYLYCANGVATTATAGVNDTYGYTEATSAAIARTSPRRAAASTHSRAAAKAKTKSKAAAAFRAQAGAAAKDAAIAKAKAKAQSGASTGAPAPLPASFWTDVRADWIGLLNAERSSEGVATLSYLHYFEPAANSWAAQQLSTWEAGGTVMHSGTVVHDMNDAACTATSTASEGIAWFTTSSGESAAAVAQDLHSTWMNSPEHKATMTNPSFSIATLGYAYDAANGRVMFVARYRAPSCTGLS